MGAFGFLPTTVTTAMVFGSTASTSSWEPFRLAIESLSKVFANCPDLVQKHKKYLDMIGWAKLDPDTPITPAFTCEINKGIFAADGTEKNLPAHIYVDDALCFWDGLNNRY